MYKCGVQILKFQKWRPLPWEQKNAKIEKNSFYTIFEDLSAKINETSLFGSLYYIDGNCCHGNKKSEFRLSRKLDLGVRLGDFCNSLLLQL